MTFGADREIKIRSGWIYQIIFTTGKCTSIPAFCVYGGHRAKIAKKADGIKIDQIFRISKILQILFIIYEASGIDHVIAR